MARQQSITCDVCGKQKQQTNHWFIVWIYPRAVSVEWSPDPISITGSPMEDTDAVDRLDVCGESCVVKKVSELIGAKA